MSKIRNKMKKQGGFTLIEMLIVVAIIAILIAVSIPVVNDALERSRQATDAANERAAKAEGTIVYLQNADDPAITGTVTYAYDAAEGKLHQTYPSNDGIDLSTLKYGKCKSAHQSGYIRVTINYGSTTGTSDEGKVEITWQNTKPRKTGTHIADLDISKVSS